MRKRLQLTVKQASVLSAILGRFADNPSHQTNRRYTMNARALSQLPKDLLTMRLKIIKSHAADLVEDERGDAMYLGTELREEGYVSNWNLKGRAIEVRESMSPDMVRSLRQSGAA